MAGPCHSYWEPSPRTGARRIDLIYRNVNVWDTATLTSTARTSYLGTHGAEIDIP